MNALPEIGLDKLVGKRKPEVREKKSQICPLSPVLYSCDSDVSLLTGGGDKPYALGMGAALTAAGLLVDFIGSDDLAVPEICQNSRINFLNLRGDQRPAANPAAKVARVLRYYAKLIRYAATATPTVFHILWHNKFELADRTLLLCYYKLLGKKLVFTAHNVNAGKRDSNDSWLNRLSLRAQYHLCDHILVHSDKMKAELLKDFQIAESKVSVIPFGINNTVPTTSLSPADARHRLGLRQSDKTLLFFGNIAPYKGVEFLVDAFRALLRKDSSYRLLIVGSPKDAGEYWGRIRNSIEGDLAKRITAVIEYVPDEATELYFKAADVLVLPYAHVFQSGVLFLGYSFGLPVIAADVGAMKDEIMEGKTGLTFQPRNSDDLAKQIDRYFKSELFQDLESNRAAIKAYANERYSWEKVTQTLTTIYSRLLRSKGRCPAAGS
jgi:glycosyltransferase involved in cell wall biosynthesis